MIVNPPPRSLASYRPSPPQLAAQTPAAKRRYSPGAGTFAPVSIASNLLTAAPVCHRVGGDETAAHARWKALGSPARCRSVRRGRGRGRRTLDRRKRDGGESLLGPGRCCAQPAPPTSPRNSGLCYARASSFTPPPPLPPPPALTPTGSPTPSPCAPPAAPSPPQRQPRRPRRSTALPLPPRGACPIQRSSALSSSASAARTMIRASAGPSSQQVSCGRTLPNRAICLRRSGLLC